MGDLEDIKDKISKAMASQGTYTPDLDLCMSLCWFIHGIPYRSI